MKIFLYTLFVFYCANINCAEIVIPESRGDSLICKNGYVSNQYVNTTGKFFFQPINFDDYTVEEIELFDQSHNKIYKPIEKYTSQSNPIFYIFKFKADVNTKTEQFLKDYMIIGDSLIQKDEKELQKYAIVVSDSFEATKLGRVITNVYNIDSDYLGISKIHVYNQFGPIETKICDIKSTRSDKYCGEIFSFSNNFVRYQCTENALNIFQTFLYNKKSKNKYGEEITDTFFFLAKSRVKFFEK